MATYIWEEKTGKTFYVREVASYDRFFIVTRSRGVLDIDTGERYPHREFKRMIPLLLKEHMWSLKLNGEDISSKVNLGVLKKPNKFDALRILIVPYRGISKSTPKNVEVWNWKTIVNIAEKYSELREALVKDNRL